MVDEPAHVKKLTLPQLQQLADEIRQELITVLAKNGGHLGPNLGVVELTIALHRVFNTPKDKFVWDVSHQIYVHKLLTGRKDRFHTIRTDGRPERVRPAHGERARLLRRRPRRHGAFRRAGHGGGARQTRHGRKRRLHLRRRGADQRHFVRGAQQHRATRRSGSSASSTTTNGASPRTSAPSPPT